MTSDVTLTDFFCGAGGSSTGAVLAGARVTMAANHWQLAIETHNSNHPDTDHDLSDLQLAHPSRFSRTTMAWFSPECTNHSIAKGRKRKGIAQRSLWGDDHLDPDEERSRATMREVVQFSEYHRYQIVIVENVVDIYHWHYLNDWYLAMTNLGYNYKTLYLNSMFFGVPQSRDRWYTVFWRVGNFAPDLDYRPHAECQEHGWVHAVQVWKNPAKKRGRYGTRRQYVYRCPQCGQDVKPVTIPAASVIDWSIDAPRIGDRDRPLADSTMRRIRRGLEKYGAFLITYYSRDDTSSSLRLPLPTVLTESRIGLVMTYNNNPTYKLTHEPLPTITALDRNALIEPDIDDVRFRLLQPDELKLGMGFPGDYIVLGTKRDQVRQIGNAVTAPVAEWLVRRCIGSLEGNAA
jgi:DNA (cytosine-5)-methyltransferase 1